MGYSLGRRQTHCGFCGTRYAADAAWPRDCTGCGETTWSNPLPVAVALLPVRCPDGSGLVVVRRDIEPARGELALPGGYVEVGETWQEAAVRELWEETGLTAEAGRVTLFGAESTPRTISIFALLPPVEHQALPVSAPTSEATEWLVTTRAIPLAFPTHTTAMASWFDTA
jgi:8-oxo-dGTP diphosphatase